MKTLMKKKLLPSFIATSLVSGLVLSSNAYAIHVAGDGVGQLLMAPLYSTLDGNVTKVAIYNTSDEDAVKVKVSLRSYGHSIEVRDFICYMTPADVCRFELITEDGVQYLTSTDDSVRNQDGTFASESALKIPFELSQMLSVDKNDTAAYGHFEVYGVYGVRGGTNGIHRTMSKYALATIFDNDRPEPQDNTGISSVDPELVRVSGDVIIESSDGERLSYQIPALVGKVGDNVVSSSGSALMYPGTFTQFDGRVIANAGYDAEGTKTTPVGQGFGPGGQDNIYEIEYALASSNVTGTYEVGGQHSEDTRVYVTFPTKYRHRGYQTCNIPGELTDLAKYSAPFASSGTVSFKIYEYDNQENRTEGYFSPSTTGTFYAEVNDFYPDGGWVYGSGYYDIVFDSAVCESQHLVTDGTTTSIVTNSYYTGMPVLAMTYKQNNAGALLIPSAFNRSNERAAK